jgi:uncharacterized protein (DUF608 family)
MAGVPHFDQTCFTGAYPIATVAFRDDHFPGELEMTAFNPMIPLNDRDSSIPGAFFEIQIHNKSQDAITYTICLSLGNPHKGGSSINRYCQNGKIHSIQMSSSQLSSDDPAYGDISVATDSDDVSYQEYWFRGSWFDSLEVFWRDFSAPGPLINRAYGICHSDARQYPGSADTGSLAARLTAEPGEIKRVRFVITWNFPNCYNYWNPEKCNCSDDSCSSIPQTWKNYYAMLFNDSIDSACYSLNNWERLERDTQIFKQTLFNSTLPHDALDAVSANISILKSPTCLRLEDGSFYGWEGCHPDAGCCEGSCTHVWNYAYALPFLFPKLERSMRDLDFTYNQREDGGMAFRLQLPKGRARSQFRPCVDGQFGGVIKAYRDWKISGDTDWLKRNWIAIKKSIEFAWAETNEDQWDNAQEGVLRGRQHHTLDMELFGPSAWLNGFYLAALKAGAEMANYLGEKSTSEMYYQLYTKGKKWVDENLFNGDYYQQAIDLKDKSILIPFPGNKSSGLGARDDSAAAVYWNEEREEIKYQIGEGCSIDQVLAQWHADLSGLGDIFDQEQTCKALQAIFNNNFRNHVGDSFNPCRLYSLNDEAGLVICDWPEGKYKPVIPIPYAEETMNGFEYQAACHMIMNGMPEEGMRVVTALRNRYDGEKRNPWNEFECGSNYARSMASYALLLAFSGFTYNLIEGAIGFHPVQPVTGLFSSFWSLDSGWGQFEAKGSRLTLSVLYGDLKLTRFSCSLIQGRNVTACMAGGVLLQFVIFGDIVHLADPITIQTGEALELLLT